MVWCLEEDESGMLSALRLGRSLFTEMIWRIGVFVECEVSVIVVESVG